LHAFAVDELRDLVTLTLDLLIFKSCHVSCVINSSTVFRYNRSICFLLSTPLRQSYVERLDTNDVARFSASHTHYYTSYSMYYIISMTVSDLRLNFYGCSPPIYNKLCGKFPAKMHFESRHFTVNSDVMMRKQKYQPITNPRHLIL